MTLDATFDPRRNSLAMLRLLLATAVAVTHAQNNGFGWQSSIGRTELGQVAVDGFFVISGLLVTRSYLSLQSLPRFAWHRFLRIMPGFWACLLVTSFVMAPIVALYETGSATAAFAGQDSAFGYVARNSALLMQQFGIDGLLEGGPGEGVFNGALWTLFYEAVCYVLLAGLGAWGLLTRRIWVVGALTASLWLALILSQFGLWTTTSTTATFVPRFGFLFLLGACAWLYRARLPISAALAALSLALLTVALVTLSDYRPLGGAALAYLVVWATVRAPLRWTPRTDLSYGMYIYHWPVQQVMVLAGLQALGTSAFVLLSLTLAAAGAFGSWHLVETRALRHKDAAWVDRLQRRWSLVSRV